MKIEKKKLKAILYGGICDGMVVKFPSATKEIKVNLEGNKCAVYKFDGIEANFYKYRYDRREKPVKIA